MGKKSKKSASQSIGFEVEGQFNKKEVSRYGSDDDDDDLFESSQMIENHKESDSESSGSDSESSSESESEESSESESSDSEPEVKHKHKKGSRSHYSKQKIEKEVTKGSKGVKGKINTEIAKPPIINHQVSKLITKHIIEDDISKSCETKFNKMISAIGEKYNPRIIVAPNWSDNVIGPPPNGFSLIMDQHDPVNPIIFDPKKFNYGTIAVKLTGSKFADGREINMESIYGNKDNIVASLNTKLNGSNAKYVEADSHLIASSSAIDASQWSARLQDGCGSFVSLCYSSESDRSSGKKYDYWALLRTGSTKLSESIYQKIEDAYYDGNDKQKTWSHLFQDDVEIRKMTDLTQRNRERLLYNVVSDCIGIDPVSMRKSIKNDVLSKTKGDRLIVTSAESISNKVQFSDGKAIFTRGTIMVDNLQKPMIFNENPFIGSLILKGHNASHEHPYGTNWDVGHVKDKSGSYAYPVDTGRKFSVNSKNTQKITIQNQFFCGTEQGTSLARLNPEIYRPRCEKFIKKESELGRDHRCGEIELTPIITKLSSV